MGRLESPDMSATNEMSPEQITHCCAAAYESDIARLLLGASLHPGGAETTKRLGQLMGLSASSHVLDIACGKGDSALVLTEAFGVHVTGIDISSKNVSEARAAAHKLGWENRLEFIVGDASSLGFADASVDAIICECAFCLFPDKNVAAREFARVLKPGGVFGLSDLTRDGVMPSDLEGLLAWVACVADARPVEAYRECLDAAGFKIEAVESANEALFDLVRQIRLRLLSAEIMVGLKRMTLPGFDFEAAKRFSKAALMAIEKSQLGYVLMTASR